MAWALCTARGHCAILQHVAMGVTAGGGVGGAEHTMLPSPLSPRAAIVLRSPEAESCRLTLTNTAQELRLSGCKLFSSSGETLPTPHRGEAVLQHPATSVPPPGDS